MGRPAYETKQDKRREHEVLGALSVKWKCEAIPSDRFHTYDAVLKRDGKVVGCVEIKCRDMGIDRYPHLIISKKKCDLIVSLCNRHPHKPKALLVVSLHDRIVGTELTPLKYETAVGGRNDRGDPADVEIVYQIPWTSFKLISRH